MIGLNIQGMSSNQNLEIKDNIINNQKKIDTSNSDAEKIRQLIIIEVKGMVCSFCAQGIEKKFNQHPSINTVNVNLEQSRVRLIVKPTKKIHDNEIITIIQNAGYKVGKIERQ